MAQSCPRISKWQLQTLTLRRWPWHCTTMRLTARNRIGLVVISIVIFAVADATAAEKPLVKCRRALLKASQQLLKRSAEAVAKCTASIVKNCGGTSCASDIQKPCDGALKRLASARIEFGPDTAACEGIDRNLLIGDTGLGFDRILSQCASLVPTSGEVNLSYVRACLLEQSRRTTAVLARIRRPQSSLVLASFAGPLAEFERQNGGARGIFGTLTSFDRPTRPFPGTFRPLIRRVCFVNGRFVFGTTNCAAISAVQAQVRACLASSAKVGDQFSTKALKKALACSDAIFACESAKDPAACLVKAKVRCVSDVGDSVGELANRLGATLNAECGASAISYAGLEQSAGFALLGCQCAVLGIGPLDTFDAFAACYQRQHRCRVLDEARFADPRFDDLLARVGIDAQELLCPLAPPVFVEEASRFGFFPNRSRFLAFRKATFSNNIQKTPSFRPHPGSPSYAARSGGPPFSGLRKVFYLRNQVLSYRLGYTVRRGRAAGTSTLVVGIQQADGSLLDGGAFEVELEDGDQETELEFEYPDTDACRFRVVAALRDADGETDFFPIDQVGNVCKAGAPDGILQDAEECDDGNTVAGDGCDPSCTLE